MEYKYKYLHICPPSTRMLKSFLIMLQTYFKLSEHHFLCRVQSEGGDGFTAISSNVINFNDLGKGKIRKFFALSRIFKESENIIIHGFSFNIPWLIFLYFNRHHLHRAVWIIWGVDLYNYIRMSGNPVKNKILNHMEYACRDACKTSIAVFPTDVAVFKKHFGNDKMVLQVPLSFNNIAFSEWDELVKERAAYVRHNPEHTVSIMIGHNAFPFNRHGEVLTLLERFKKENILLILPLSYGNDYGVIKPNYPRDIQNLLKNLSMTDKARILHKLLPKSSYYRLLANLDIAILNAPRQNGLGNIIPLLYMGKKVYLAADNPLLKFFREKGFEIHDVQEIATSTYEEFIEPIKVPYPHPWIKFYYSIETAAPRWHIVFDYNDGKLSREEAESGLAALMKEQEVVMLHQLDEMKTIAKGEKLLKEKKYPEACQLYNALAQSGKLDAVAEAGAYLLGEDDNDAVVMGVNCLKTAAEAGHSEAVFNLGRAYEAGCGVDRDTAKAFELFSFAAEQGNAAAMSRAGMYLCNGYGGIEKAPEKGFELLVKAANSKDNFALGWRLSRAKKLKEALPFYENAAADGNPDAMHYAGMYLCNGYGGIKKNIAKGVEYFTMAANICYEYSLIQLAKMYESGEYVIEDKEKACELYDIAAKNRNVDAMASAGIYLCAKEDDDSVARGVGYLKMAADAGCTKVLYELARDYETGHGTEKDVIKAFELYSQAAENGNVTAMCRAGLYLCNGYDGMEKDTVRGISLLTRAAENNDLEAIRTLASIYDAGCDVARDQNHAMELYRKAAEIGDTDAMSIVGNHICKTAAEGDADELAKGISYLRKSVLAGNIDAVLGLAHAYEKGIGVEYNKEMAIELYERAAEKGSLYAMDVMGMYLCNCRQDDIDEVTRGFTYIKKAAEGNNPSALANLALSYETGFCVEQNIDKALEYYDKAASQGNMSAKKRAYVIRKRLKKIKD